MRNTLYLCIFFLFAYCCSSVWGQTVPLSPAQIADSTQLQEIIDLINTNSRDDRAQNRYFPALADSAAILAKNLVDTNALIRVLWAKSSWYRDNGRDSIADMIDIDRKWLISGRGYTMEDEMAGIDDRYSYPFNSMRWSLKIFVDSTGQHIDFDSIHTQAFQTRFGINSYINRDLDSAHVYWIKIRLKGNEKSFQEYLLLPNADDQLWQQVSFFKPGINGEWEVHQGGTSVPIEARMTNGWRDFYKIELTPTADYSVYFRLQGFKSTNWPYGLSFRTLNASFLTETKPRNYFRVYVFIGILSFQFLFFLFWSLSTKESAFVPYLLYILSLIPIALCSVQFRYWFPNPDFERYELLTLLQLCLVWFSGLSLVAFTRRFLNSKSVIPKWHKAMVVFSIVFSVVAILIVIPVVFWLTGLMDEDAWYVGPLNEFLNINIAFFILLLVVGLALIALSGWMAWRNKFKPAKFFMLATIALFLGVGIPAQFFVFNALFIDTYDTALSIVQAGILLQLCLFAFGLGNKRRSLELEKLDAQNKLLEEQSKVNTAFGRFVPHKFLEAIGRDSVLDIELGDGVEKKVTVFFSDIRGYTQLAEQMKPEENFMFLNGYLGRLGPIIADHQGFVNQYYGDGIMAIFMQKPEQALQAAIAIHERLQAYNRERALKNRAPITIGIGLHTGPLIMGVIGDTLRMEAGVVSDTVNTASRMEGLTKHFGVRILVSETFMEGIQTLQDKQYRYLGKVQVKGRKEPLKVYDFFSGDPKALLDKKIQTKSDFDEAIQAYYKREFAKAARAFDKVLEVFPDDKSSLNYAEKAKDYLVNGIEEGWSGVEEILVK